MRERRFVLAMVLIAVAILLFGLTLAYAGQVTTTTVPAGSALKLQPVAVTSETVRVNWSDAPRGTHVYLTTATQNCTQPSGVVGTANGSSGSFSTLVDPGRTYLLFACGGFQFRTATLNYSVSGGLGFAELLGILSLLAGLVVLYLSLRPDYGREGDDTRIPTDRRRRQSIAAALSSSLRRVREARAQPSAPPQRRSPRLVQRCPECGRIYTFHVHATCPACGANL